MESVNGTQCVEMHNLSLLLLQLLPVFQEVFLKACWVPKRYDIFAHFLCVYFCPRPVHQRICGLFFFLLCCEQVIIPSLLVHLPSHISFQVVNKLSE